jgi:hypothetical protein
MGSNWICVDRAFGALMHWDRTSNLHTHHRRRRFSVPIPPRHPRASSLKPQHSERLPLPLGRWALLRPHGIRCTVLPSSFRQRPPPTACPHHSSRRPEHCHKERSAGATEVSSHTGAPPTPPPNRDPFRHPGRPSPRRPPLRSTHLLPQACASEPPGSAAAADA